MNIEILGGEKEIGGNKILIEHKGTSILLDFGMSFGKNSDFYAEFLNPRKAASLKDFFEMGLLPDIPGIYRQDYLKHMDRPEEEKSVDALLLSHAHMDHTAYMHFLRGDIPIYCTESTKLILTVLEETGKGTFKDYVTYCDAFEWRLNNKEKFSRVTRSQKDYVHEREFHIVEPDQKIQIGSLEVEMCPVDHSIRGACGYIIYSDEGNLVYTGDIRFHGRNRELSERFVEKAVAAKPKWLLCEGTRINSDRIDSEFEVQNTITKWISEAKGLVLVEHPIRDLDRIYSLYLAAKENNREFVIPTKLAALIEKMGEFSPFKVSEVKIFTPRKGWGLIYKENFESYQIELDYSGTSWEKQFLDYENTIKADEIAKNPQKYVVSMSMWEIGNLIDIKPKNATWIKSSCEPFTEEMIIDAKRKENWIKHFGITHFSKHASGHASGVEILDMISKIKPESVIAIHTEHPEAFKKSKKDFLVWIEQQREIKKKNQNIS